MAVTYNNHSIPISMDSQSGFHSNLLWVCLIHGSIHAHGEPHRPQTTVLPDSTQDGGQTRSHQIGGPEGDYRADVLNSNTVFRRRRQTEPCEDVLRVLQTIFVPGM